MVRECHHPNIVSALQHTLKPNFVRQELINDAYEDALGAGEAECVNVNWLIESERIISRAEQTLPSQFSGNYIFAGVQRSVTAAVPSNIEYYFSTLKP